MTTLENLPFNNRYSRLPEAFYQRVAPTPFARPHLVVANPDAAALIGLNAEALAHPSFARYFCGAEMLPGAEPLAMLYAGNQFGTWVPQLGDGRAILLGQVEGPDGAWDLQLKGAGKTAFSRMGDGRAVLRSVVREYLCSEAMHGLGIPTTRALCIVGSDEPVYRETVETGAMMTRMSPSHVRFGSFQVFASRNQHDHLKTLADHVIEHHFPELAGQPDAYPRLLATVAERTGQLVARWQTDGFVHGVLNSDNMSILGLTIDYGPFAFIDRYQHDYVRNHTDRTGFYAYNRQPDIGRYNLYLLANALLPLMDTEQAQAGLDAYMPAFTAAYRARMAQKLGLADHAENDALYADLFDLMHAGHVDFACFFRGLSDFRTGGEGVRIPEACARLVDQSAFGCDDSSLLDWFQRYATRLAGGPPDDERKAAMDRVNPRYLLRNHLCQDAIDLAEDGDFSEIERLHRLLRDPFTEHPGMEAYAAPPPATAPVPLLSCSS
ncbi:MAG: YdiU family protein [Nitrospirota bacterium]|nr:YdiU family protein [Nitrospirota bacterium]